MAEKEKPLPKKIVLRMKKLVEFAEADARRQRLAINGQLEIRFEKPKIANRNFR